MNKLEKIKEVQQFIQKNPVKARQYNYNTRSQKTLVEQLQKENDELKNKYMELEKQVRELQIQNFKLKEKSNDEI